MPLTLVAALRSVTGEHRAANEDSAGCSSRFALVADGVGGHAGGDVASGTVVQRLVATLGAGGDAGADRAASPSAEDLRTAVEEANGDLVRRTRRDPDLTGMATTLTGVFCAGDTVRLVHIGDSRAYRWRDGQGRRLSRDDSLVQLLVDEGVIDPADAAGHPRRNVILHCLGGDPADPAHVTVADADVRAGDRLLLATDGLTDYVPEGHVLAVLGDAADPQEAVDRLVTTALDADAWDNVTVVVADVVEDGGSASSGVVGQVRTAGAAAGDGRAVLGSTA
ncbi:PP2C family protein-serine/threonine phosphatase [Cellulomonas triticagri]|uniref:PP2C family protein-serine/threonine phosphatase n=1 Tax=Cellulomonas triticagri TaxID=2483352 RepID=UPI001315302B|nr:protein phosphatase 2C domain-containing protein [Cellulomonas triticagri]